MMLHSGELPLRGAARSKEEAASWGSSTAVLRGAAGMGEGGGCFWGELPLRGAARLWEGGAGCVWGSSRCAELLDRGREEAAPSGGAPAARSCWDGGGRRLILEELPPPAGRRILILAGTPGPSLKNTNSSKKSVKVLIYTNSSEIGESMSPLCARPGNIPYEYRTGSFFVRSRFTQCNKST